VVAELSGDDITADKVGRAFLGSHEAGPISGVDRASA
jgi:hypothetical protein